MSVVNRRDRFRAIMNGQHCVHPITVFDAISARIAENIGFEVGMLAGSIGSLAVLGVPDVAVLTLTEFAEQVHRICRACTTLPVFADADHGYGNALSVMRTVQELETIGISALTIEDTYLPEAYSGDGPSLISIEEGIGKMKAALLSRKEKNLAIIGRTSAIAKTSVEDAIKRIKAYEAAGVDAIFLAGVTSCEQLDLVSKEVNLPLVLGSIPASMTDKIAGTNYLAERGVRMSLRGHQPFMATIQAVYDTMKRIRGGENPRTLPNLPSASLVEKVTMGVEFKEWSQNLLGISEPASRF